MFLSYFAWIVRRIRAFAVKRVCRSNKGTSKTCIVVSFIFCSFRVVFLFSAVTFVGDAIAVKKDH